MSGPHRSRAARARPGDGRAVLADGVPARARAARHAAEPAPSRRAPRANGRCCAPGLRDDRRRTGPPAAAAGPAAPHVTQSVVRLAPARSPAVARARHAHVMSDEHDITFHSMGSDVRLLIGPPLLRDAPSPAVAAERERAYVEDFAARLSRFRPDSELSALNARPARAGARLAAAARRRAAPGSGPRGAAAGWSTRRSSGALERVGYATLARRQRSPRRCARRSPPRRARRPARPHPARLWRRIVDRRASAGRVARPAGVRIDTGGTGKGLCADAVAHRLARLHALRRSTAAATSRSAASAPSSSPTRSRSSTRSRARRSARCGSAPAASRPRA